MAVVASPAEAKKNAKQPEKKWAEVMPDPDNGEPLTLIVSLRDQQLEIYRGLSLIAKSKVSTGTAAYPTKAGVFSILEKRRYHHSNMYSAAPMPWMQRLPVGNRASWWRGAGLSRLSWLHSATVLVRTQAIPDYDRRRECNRHR
jgi:hypothetical protein